MMKDSHAWSFSPEKAAMFVQEVHPILDEIEEEYAGKGFGFYHVDVEDEKDLFNRFLLKRGTTGIIL